MEMYKVKLHDISNVILKDHKRHYKVQGDVGLVRRLLVEADGLDDDLGDGVRVAVAARPPVLQVAVTLLRALPAPITAQYCYRSILQFLLHSLFDLQKCKTCI